MAFTSSSGPPLRGALGLLGPLSLSVLLASTSLGCVRWGTPDEDIAEGSEDTDTGTDTDTGPEADDSWPEQSELHPDTRMVVWGKTGIPTSNLEFWANTLRELGGADDQLEILWFANCDPRVDPDGCLAGNLDPFFEVIADLGTIDFHLPSDVDPGAYDVVVVDFCGPIEADDLRLMLEGGHAMMVLADYSCLNDGKPSSDEANDALRYVGTRFNGERIYNHEFLVAQSLRVGVLEGVSSLDAWGIAAQEVRIPGGFESAIESLRGALVTTLEGQP